VRIRDPQGPVPAQSPGLVAGGHRQRWPERNGRPVPARPGRTEPGLQTLWPSGAGAADPGAPIARRNPFTLSMIWLGGGGFDKRPPRLCAPDRERAL